MAGWWARRGAGGPVPHRRLGPRSGVRTLPPGGPACARHRWLLRRALGSSAVVDLAFGGRHLSADVAWQLGLVTAVAADPEQAVHDRVELLAADLPPPPSVRLAAALAGPDRTRDLEAAIAHDVELAALWGPSTPGGFH